MCTTWGVVFTLQEDSKSLKDKSSQPLHSQTSLKGPEGFDSLKGAQGLVCSESESVVVSTTMLPGMQFMACAFFDALKGGGCKSCACVYVSRRDSFRGEGCMGGQLDVVGWEQRKGSGELSAAVHLCMLYFLFLSACLYH